MKKVDLVSAVAEQAGITKKDAGVAVNSVFAEISKALGNGEKVTITGFGTFSVVDRKARNGRNPKTQEPLVIEATVAPKFKAGKSLKNIVKG